MPLTGSVSDRIRELIHHGKQKRSHKQIVAIAVHSAEEDGASKSAMGEGKTKTCTLQELLKKHLTKPKKPDKTYTEPLKFSYESLREALSKAADRVHTSPSDAQRKAGNYRMGHVRIQGLDITIENPIGSIRSGQKLLRDVQFPAKSSHNNSSSHVVVVDRDTNNSPSSLSKGFVLFSVQLSSSGLSMIRPINLESKHLLDVCKINVESSNSKIGNSDNTAKFELLKESILHSRQCPLLPPFSNILIPPLRTHGEGTHFIAFPAKSLLNRGDGTPENSRDFGGTAALLIQQIHLFGADGKSSHVSNVQQLVDKGNSESWKFSLEGDWITVDWAVQMTCTYGYIKRTESEADGDHVDVFVGPHPESEVVFIIDQRLNDKFDEHKCMVGFLTSKEAKDAYPDNYSAGWKGFDDIRALTMDQFKKWVKKGDTHRPIAKQVLTFNAECVKLSLRESLRLALNPTPWYLVANANKPGGLPRLAAMLEQHSMPFLSKLLQTPPSGEPQYHGEPLRSHTIRGTPEHLPMILGWHQHGEPVNAYRLSVHDLAGNPLGHWWDEGRNTRSAFMDFLGHGDYDVKETGAPWQQSQPPKAEPIAPETPTDLGATKPDRPTQMALENAPTPAESTTRPLPAWVPQETPGKEDTTGFIANPDSQSWIAGLKYTRDRGAEMTVRKGGKNYPYPGFNLEMFRRWVQAQSKGKWWWMNVGHPMKGQPKQLSRFTGMVHPLFTPQADGPIDWHEFNPPQEQYTPDAIMDWARRHISPRITPAHLAALTGWLPGSKTYVHHEGGSLGRGYQLAGTEPTNLTFNTHAHGYDASRVLHSHTSFQDKMPRIENLHQIIEKAIYHPDTLLPMSNPYRGTSAANLLRQMRAAHEMNIPKIHWTAGWNEPRPGMAPSFGDFTGGLHWPMIGANGILPRDYFYNEIPPEIMADANEKSGGSFDNTHMFSDFFKSPAAKEWYQSHPVEHKSFVETAPGSYSRTNVERHVSEAAAHHGMAGPLPDQNLYQIPHEGMEEQQAPSHEGNLSRFQKLLFHRMTGRRQYHPAIEHLIGTGSCHPEYLDEYFNK